LLRLPLEIRDRIWRHVFHDGRLLHIKHVDHVGDQEKRKPWRNAFCVSLDTPYDTYEKFKKEPQTTSGTGSIVWATGQYDDWFPHCRCEEYIKTRDAHDGLLVSEGTAWEYTPTKETVQFQLFRVCRQTYFEANRVFWSNTTLSFDDPHSFRQFMAGRTTYHKKQLRKLHLELLFLHSEDIDAWNEVLPITLVRSLAGLRVFHLHVRHETSCRLLYMSGLPQAVNDSARDMTFENLLNLQILPLRNVTVVWQRHYGNAAKSEDWSLTRNREWAEFFKERFLNPRGLEVWQEYKDMQKLIRERENEIALACKRRNVCGRGNRARCLERRQHLAEIYGREIQECIYLHRCDECGYYNNGPDCHKPECKSKSIEVGHTEQSNSLCS
jgi:hypothetical protein